jgi:excisionase family DNA binding protein
MEQRYLSVAETAAYLGLSPKTVYAWAEKGAMPAHKVGRVWRFDRTELDDFVRGQRPNGFV